MFNKKFLVTLTLVIAFVISCGKNDPNKPDTWIAKLENPKTKSEAIDKLAEIKAEAALDKLLEILKEDELEIVLLHNSGLKHKELAKMLNVPLSTVLSKYKRSLAKMKKFLQEN